jgi:hypothetical protein
MKTPVVWVTAALAAAIVLAATFVVATGKQSSSSACVALDCFASLAMTW